MRCKVPCRNCDGKGFLRTAKPRRKPTLQGLIWWGASLALGMAGAFLACLLVAVGVPLRTAVVIGLAAAAVAGSTAGPGGVVTATVACLLVVLGATA